ncbi:hypothetical protein [Desulfovibrio gilichinskyi]|uniref:Uncharacterized protein n=1 Tax=Desulfovibrio gilichinskyi TaxID=1519643 RepID=A0A1X7D686_9BACT|nr:hypothetical protein [Desulfovibrio gilichinskyi]SMF09572.1 hypothetical protein SAMN06295933_1704 [Desulfovibrio gilichinskyi]
MAKSVFISILEKDEAKGKGLFQTVTRYGLAVNGHFWSENLEKMEWAGPIPEIGKPEVGVWLIKGSKSSYENPNIRFGLGLLAAAVQARRGHGFPILCLCDEGDLDVDSLPTMLRSAEVVDEAHLGAKLAAKANMPIKKIEPEYRFDLYPLPSLGLWLEVGPAPGHSWTGALLGVSGGEITAHGAGPAGMLPDKCVLNYPMQGLKLELGGKEYTGWAIKNELSENESYFVKVAGTPESLLFGEFSEGDDAELFSLSLK